MAKIEHISVKVTYRVGLGGLKVPKKILDQLNELAKRGDEIEQGRTGFNEAEDWLNDNIRERDCFDCVYEIEELN